MPECLNEMFGHNDEDYKDCSLKMLKTKKWQGFGNVFVISNTSENGVSVETQKVGLEDIQSR